MKLTRSQRANPWLANLIPVVDIVFLLLIFFVLGSTFILQPGISVTPPLSKFMLGPVSNPAIVSITATPSTRLYFQNAQVSLEELAGQLKGTDSESRSVIIKADRFASYDVVMRVANLCIENGFSVILAASPSENRQDGNE